MNEKEMNDDVEVDLFQLARAMWKKAWMILLAALLLAVLCFGVTKLFLRPNYRANTTLFVNNKVAEEISKDSVSTNDLSASFHLVETYKVFLQSRSTLDEVISRLSLPYRYEQLKKMVEVVAIEETSAFHIVVTSHDPEEAAQIANTLGEVLPGKITEFIPGSSVRVVDRAVVPKKPVGPSALKNSILGAVLGAILGAGFVAAREMMYGRIHSEDDLKQSYDIPVLAVIPDLMTAEQGGGYRSYAGFSRTGSQEEKSHD